MAPDNQKLILDESKYAQFGDYGEQGGDRKASLPADGLLDQTVEAIVRFIKEGRP